MPATLANELLEEAKCYLCLGVSLPEALILAELDRLAADTCPTPATTALPATNISTLGADANWTAVPGATQYRFDLSTDPAFGSFVLGYDNANFLLLTSATLAGLSPVTTYYYRLRVVNACGTSENSNVIEFETLPLNDSLVLDDGVNSPTVIANPVGDYDFTGEAWVSVWAKECPNLTGLNLSANTALTELRIDNCPALVALIVSDTQLPSLDLTEIATTGVILTLTSNPSLASVDASNVTNFESLSVIDNVSLVTLDISSATTVTTDMTVNTNVLTNTVDWSAITGIGGSITFAGNVNCVNLDLSGCTDIIGDCNLNDLFAISALATIDLSALVAVGGNFNTSTNGFLTTLTTPLLATIGGGMTITNCALLAAIELPVLTTVGGNVDIEQNDSLTTLDLTSLATCQSFVVNLCQLLTVVSAGLLTTVNGGLTVDGMSVMTILNFPSLTTVTAAVVVTSNALLDTVDISALETAASLQVEGNAVLPTLAFTALVTISGTITIQTCPLLATLTFPALEEIGSDSNIHDLDAASVTFPAFANPMPDMLWSGNANLVTFSMNGQDLVDNGSYDLSGCALSEASVDLVLAAGVSGGMASGVIDLSGGSNSPPGAQGVIDAGILTTAGVSVTTN